MSLKANDRVAYLHWYIEQHNLNHHIHHPDDGELLDQPMTWHSHFRLVSFQDFLSMRAWETGLSVCVISQWLVSLLCMAWTKTWFVSLAGCFLLKNVLIYICAILLVCVGCLSFLELIAGGIQGFAPENKRWLAQKANCCKSSYWI